MRSNPIFHAIEGDMLFIRDAGGETHMSITNDAEAVVMKCHETFPQKRIIYCDSEGEWSELLHDKANFTGFAEYTGPVPHRP